MAKSTFRDALKHKRRELHDLANFIGTRAGSTPNYSLLLGAGCSVTSGVRSASELVEIWRKDLYEKLAPGDAPQYARESAIEYFSRECSQWYNWAREYSSLFEKKFDLPRQRRMFVESEVAGKLPSLGYAYLMHLVKKKFFNTIFTTNFDDLLNEAFHHFSDERPIVCAHDSSIASVTVTSERPKIIKLHGDYLFDDIKSTQRETESLEQNTKRKFMEFCKDFGLIVVGYSGCDRSIMDVLNGLLRNEEYLKNGVYWCVRSGDEEIGEELERFLWRDRVYWVEVEGFDELLASLYFEFLGDALPIDTLMVSEKPRKIIQTFCDNPRLSQSDCGVIQSHLEKFRRDLHKEQVVDAFRGLRDLADGRESPVDSLRDDQTAKLFRIRRLISLRELKQAQKMLSEELSSADRDGFFVELGKLKFEVDQELGDYAGAKSIIEKLKDYDQYDPSYLNLEAQIEGKFETKSRILKASLNIQPYNTFALNELAVCSLDASERLVGSARSTMIEEGLNFYRKSMEADPSIRNPAWVRFSRYLMRADGGDRSARQHELDQVLARYEGMNPRSHDLISLRIERISSAVADRESEKAQSLIDEIASYRDCAPKHSIRKFDYLHLRALASFFRRGEFHSRVAEKDLDSTCSRDSEYQVIVAKAFSSFGEYDSALERALKAFDLSPCAEYALLAATLAETLGDVTVFDRHGERFVSQLSAEELVSYQIHEARTKGDHERALKLVRARMKSADKNEYVVEETHELLLAGQYLEAERVARAVLDEVAFSPYYGALIINYELARRAQRAAVNKGRLGELAKHADDALVKAAALYLLGDSQKSEDEFKKLFADRPGAYRTVRDWFMFKGEGADFLKRLQPA